MVTREEVQKARSEAGKLLSQAGISFSEEELGHMDIADFGLSDLRKEGAQILPLFETERVACRVIVLFQGQTEPEHWHESVGSSPGKEETLRVVRGILRVCTDGEDNLDLGCIPEGKEKNYTCRHQILLAENETLTLYPGRKHWFQAAGNACVFYSMSTKTSDDFDPFTDPEIVRKTVIAE